MAVDVQWPVRVIYANMGVVKDLSPAIQKTIRSFAETVALNKGQAFFVGGTVRDTLLGLPLKDIDIEVHGIEPKALRRIVDSHFSEVEEQGNAFGVLRVFVEEYEVDISLPRKDSKVAPGHTGFDVNVDPMMAPEEALRRRDFTINAMLQDILSGEIVDPFGGQQDLKDRVLKVVDPQTFSEDPLRVLRAVQLTGRLELVVSDETIEQLRSVVPHLEELSLDRKRTEWRKLFLRSKRPSFGLDLAHRVGVFDDMQIVDAMAKTPQEPKWHPEGDVWTHTKWVVDEAAAIARREELDDEAQLIVILGALCHDLGKPATTKKMDGRIRSRGHSDAGMGEVGPLLTFMGFDRFVKPVEPIVAYHLETYHWYARRDTDDPAGDGAFRKAARRLKPATLLLLSYVSEADLKGRGPFPEGSDVKSVDSCVWFRKRAKGLGIAEAPPDDIIRGNDLLKMGFKPGPYFGGIIRAGNVLHDDHGWERDQILEAIEKRGDDLVLEGEDAIVERLLK